MKKSLLALATLGLFAGAASAQSSVTLFGIVDAAYGHVSANGKSVSGISNSGINSSRLGFRGVEDIGGGLKANFHLEGALANDNGTPGGFNFLRRSTVGLMGGFGEIRLGREYTPTFWSLTAYDPFGTNGVGQSLTPNMLNAYGQNAANTANAAGTATNAVRANNSINYFLPAMGGLEGWFQYAFGENGAAASGKKANNYFGFRLGYAAGPISAHYAYGKTTGANVTAANSPVPKAATTTAFEVLAWTPAQLAAQVEASADVKYSNFGASYDMGVIKPTFVWAQEKTGTGKKVTGLELGLVAPVGAGEVHAAWSKYDVANSANDWNKLALGYVHNLSKRTALYATYAKVSNKGNQTVDVSNNGLRAVGTTLTGVATLPAGQAGWAAPGGSSTGYEFGLRHSF